MHWVMCDICFWPMEKRGESLVRQIDTSRYEIVVWKTSSFCRIFMEWPVKPIMWVAFDLYDPTHWMRFGFHTFVVCIVRSWISLIEIVWSRALWCSQLLTAATMKVHFCVSEYRSVTCFRGYKILWILKILL